MRALLGLLWLPMVLLLAAFVYHVGGSGGVAPSGSIYYVSSSATGSGNGLSPGSPWTVTQANVGPAGGYVAGNIIEFDSSAPVVPSSTCTGTSGNFYLSANTVMAPTINISTVSPPTSSMPLTITSYGSGTATLVSSCPGVDSGTTGPNSIAVLIDGVSHVVWNGVNISANGTTTQYGLIYQSATYAAVTDFTLENSAITGFHLNTGATTSVSYEAIIASAPLNEASSGNQCAPMSDINILNNTIGGVTGNTSPDDNGLGLAGSYSGGCSGTGGNTLTTLPISSVLIAGNTISDMGGRGNSTPNSAGVDGTVFIFVRNATYEYNLIHDLSYNAVHCTTLANVWLMSYNSTSQFNEVYNDAPKSAGAVCDSGAFDIDGSSNTITVQYNYSHNNAGGGLVVYVGNRFGTLPYGNDVMRYNVSENDSSLPAAGSLGSITLNVTGVGLNPAASIYIYNNTIYQSGTKTNQYAIYSPQTGNGYSNTVIANNILGTAADTSGNNKFVGIRTSTGPKMVNNAYWSITPGTFWASETNGSTVYNSLSAWQAVVTGGEVGATTTAPVLAGTPPNGACIWTPRSAGPGPQGAGCPSVYKLNNSSVAYRGTGLDLTASPYNQNVGTRDYYGNTIPNGVGTGYNIGAYGG